MDKLSLPLAIGLLATLLGACEPERPSPSHGPLEFRPCPARIPDGVAGECAVMTTRARAEEPSSALIEVVLKRSTTPNARGQLWLIDGGPGGSGASLEDAALVSAIHAAGFDVYIPTQRGTGASTPFVCPAEERPESPEGRELSLTEAPSCIASLEAQYGADLASFSGDEAARDLGRLIELARVPGQSVALFGGSYGSYLVQRYLQQFPDQADAIVLDGVVPLDADLSRQLLDAEPAGDRYFARCAADEACRSRLGAAPRLAFEELLAALERGECAAATAAGLGGSELRALARHLVDVLVLGYAGRPLLAGLVHRLRRCDELDAKVFAHLAKVLASLADEGPARDNLLLGYLVAANSLWPELPLDLEAHAELHASALLSSPEEALPRARMLELWRLAQRQPRAELASATQLPMLLLNGELDTASPLAWAERTAAQYPGARLVSFPTAGHGAIFSSPLPSGEQCAMALMFRFLHAPTAPLDSSCVAQVEPIDFAGESEAVRDLALALFGTADLYGDR